MPEMGGNKIDLGKTEGPQAGRSIEMSNGDEAIAALGDPREARKTATITIREPNGEVEIIETSWGPQEAKKGSHYVAKDSNGEYPYEKDVFKINMEEHPDRPGEYRKNTLSRLIEVPEGVTIHCVTIDQGEQKPLQVTHPDFIVIGAKNEVYPLKRDTFEKEFGWAR